MKKKASIYLLVIILAGLLLATLLIFTPKQENLKSKQNFADKIMKSQPNIEQVIKQHEADLMNTNGVIGLGISECQQEPCIKVYLENNTPELKEKIPTHLGQFKVDIEVIGSVEALPPK